MDPMEQIKATFFQECEELLADLEAGLMALETGEGDAETVNAVFRAVHSVKGGAGAFGLDALVRFAHVFETTLDEMRSGRLEPSAPVLQTMLRAADVLADQVAAARSGAVADEARAAGLAEELAAIAGKSVPSANGAADSDADLGVSEEDILGGLDFTPVQAPEPAPEPVVGGRWRIVFRPLRSLYAKANDASTLLRELRRLGEDLTERETIRARDGLIAQYETEDDLTRARAGSLSDDLFHFGRPLGRQVKLDALRAVTLKRVAALAAGLPLERLCVATLGPKPL